MIKQTKKSDEPSLLAVMQEEGLIKIEPNTQPMDLSDTSRFVKTTSCSASDMKLSALSSQLPYLSAAAEMSGMYTVRFPEGVAGTLTKLNQGGYGSMLKGVDGKFTGTASFFSAAPQAATLAAFTTMAIVSQQYFLTQINSELKLINQKIDKILGFLYGDKKAELLSEICFVQRAFRDYASIMENESHRVATIAGIQQAEKVAMKDIEFYIQDLDMVVNDEAKNSSELVSTVQTAVQVYESLNASLQLYIIACVLEVYYSQNTNSTFLENLESDLFLYTNKCYSRMLSGVSILKEKVNSYKTKGKFDKEPILEKLVSMSDSLHEGQAIETQNTITNALDAITKETTFIVTENGDVYHQIA